MFGSDPTNIGFSEALGINESGEVVGRATVGPDHAAVHAFVWLPNARPDWRLPGSPTPGMAAGMHDLTEAIRQIAGFTLATDGAALDINVHGQIVGEQVVAPGVEAQAFMWDLAGLYTPTAQVIVPSVDGFPSRAWDINDGYLDAVVAAQRDVATVCGLDNHGRKETLRVLLGSPTASITVLAQSGPDARESFAALAANTPPAGQTTRVVGTGDLCGPLQVCGSDFDAVWWGLSPGSGQKLAEGLTALATAQGINDTGVDGEIVGYGQFLDPQFGGCTLHAWYWASPGAASVADLHVQADPPLSFVESVAEEISNADECGRKHVAGWAATPETAVLWRSDPSSGQWESVSVSTSSAAALCGWQDLNRALDVNTAGCLVGFGDRNPLSGVDLRGFVAIPTECITDVNGDSLVDGGDLGLVLSAWGPCIGGCMHCQLDIDVCRFDFDCSGEVDGADVGIVLAQWTETGCPCSVQEEDHLASQSILMLLAADEAALEDAMTALGFDSGASFAAWGASAPLSSLSAVGNTLRMLLTSKALDAPQS